jgi:hypothetical protein
VAFDNETGEHEATMFTYRIGEVIVAEVVLVDKFGGSKEDAPKSVPLRYLACLSVGKDSLNVWWLDAGKTRQWVDEREVSSTGLMAFRLSNENGLSQVNMPLVLHGSTESITRMLSSDDILALCGPENEFRKATETK